ncbi:hypothetical protein Leucomu_04030 [Leucobacter muris]|uniref:Uncharacterized protein n=1 Tax=Leucobacter muris TaxID=1935379 RepID=A0ABX5QDT5_9MICO|nr:hypothetical protein [Leucobacter muris]QAB17201.1 hypothetical protein Leucomu_04030 [Leucobacter muris]
MRNMMRLAIASATAFLLVLGSATAANAEPIAPEDFDPTPVSGEIGYRVNDRDRLPEVDSEVGIGAVLGTEPGSLVALGESALGYGSALLRVSVFSPAQDTVVFQAGGVASLRTPAGVSASTTVLVPIDAEGRAQLWANAPVQVRVEALAAFNGSQAQPGSTIALPEPVLRADTRSGLAGTGIGSEPIHVGLTGQGGVPTERVRGAYVTITAELDGAGTLDIGTQRVSLPAGVSTFTTVLSPDADGGVPASLAGATGHLSLHVIGWMADAPDQGTQLSLPGSFVPTSSLDETFTDKVTERRDDFATLTRNSDAAYSIGLVALAPTTSTERSFFEFGPAYSGRARGAVVDPARGAAPQLVIVPASTGSDDDGDGYTLRRGEAQLSWLPVGDILGEEQRQATKNFEISIDTHQQGEGVDLSEDGYFTLGGTITSEGVAPSLDRVEISVDAVDGILGYADVWEEAGVLRWEADLSAPQSGTFAYSVEAFDRGDNSKRADVSLDVHRFTEDDTVIDPEIHVLNETPGVFDGRVVAEEPDTVYVSASRTVKPGDTLISGATEATPSGLFAEVESFDRVGDEWRVRTVMAKIEDVFLQVDIDEDEDYDNLGESELDESNFQASLEENGAPVEVEAERLPGDVGYETAEIVTGDDVDLDPFPDECDPTGTDTSAIPCPPTPIEMVGATAGQPDIRSAVLKNGAPGGIRPAVSAELSTAFGIKVNTKLVKRDKSWGITDVGASSADPEAEVANEVKQWAKEGSVKGGVGISLAAQALPSLKFTLETEITWKWRVIPTGITVTKFAIEVSNTLKAQAAISLFIKFEGALTLSQRVMSINLPITTIMAGPVPIVLQNTIELVMKATLELKATATAKIGFSRTDTVGTQYTPEKGWESLNKPTKSSSLPLGFSPIADINAEFEGELAVGPVFAPNTALYGVAGPQLDISIRAGIAGEIKYSVAKNKWVLSAEVFAELGYAVKVKLKLFTKEWDHTINEKKFKFVFWSDEWEYGGDASGVASLGPPGGRSFAAPPPIPV